MTDSELFEMDAEYWFDSSHIGDLNKYIPRLCFVATEYGNNLDVDGNYIDTPAFSIRTHDIRMWFSLLIAEDLRVMQ